MTSYFPLANLSRRMDKRLLSETDHFRLGSFSLIRGTVEDDQNPVKSCLLQQVDDVCPDVLLQRTEFYVLSQHKTCGRDAKQLNYL